MNRTSETAFENAIEDVFLSSGFQRHTSNEFDRENAIFPSIALKFIQNTQPKIWDKLELLHGEKTGDRVIAALCKWMDTNGSLNTLRHGFKCYGKTLHITFFKPAHGLNPELEARYAANIIGLTRQLHFSPKNEKSLDVTLSINLEKLYTYLKHLALKLPKRKSELGYQFDEEIQLEYYRLQKISEGSISLHEGYATALNGPKDVGSGKVRENDVPLSRLIDLINERFGENLNEADQLFFDQIAEAAALIEAISHAAQANPKDKFQLVFDRILESLFIERMEINEDLFARYMNDPEFKELVSQWLGQQVYRRIPKTVSYLTPKKSK